MSGPAMRANRPAVFVLDPVGPTAMNRLRPEVDLIAWTEPRVGRWQEEADAVIVNRRGVSAAELAAARRLKVISKHGIGVDNIDVAAARERGIVVTNAPGASSLAVSEHAVGLMLAVLRRIVLSNRLARAGETGWHPDFRGAEIAGKTVGVVGVGNIGRRVAAILGRGFGARVLGLDPYLSAETWAALPFPPERVPSLAGLLPQVDILTLHVPLTDETRGMIDARALARLPAHAIVVNTSRGGVVDEAALAAALASGRIAGAALDVFSVEPPTGDHPLLAFPTVVFTAHIAGYSAEAMAAIGNAIAEDILAVLEGRPPRFSVA